MYYVDRGQIEQRFRYIDEWLLEAVGELQKKPAMPPSLERLAWERTLHLAAELVTDIGSLMIDGFIMRDASSYEDIVEVLREEGVFDDSLGAALHELVKLRKPLVQRYYALDASMLEVWKPRLVELLQAFRQSVKQYLQRELLK